MHLATCGTADTDIYMHKTLLSYKENVLMIPYTIEKNIYELV